MSAEWAIFDVVERMLARQGRTKHWADGAFTSVVLEGTLLVDDGLSKKVKLCDSDTINYGTATGGATSTMTLGYLSIIRIAQMLGHLGTGILDSVGIRMTKYGTPPDLKAEIRENDYNGALIASATVLASSVSPNPTFATYTIPLNAEIDINKEYCLVLYGDGGNANNYYMLYQNYGSDIGSPYYKGNMHVFNGSSWTPTAYDIDKFEITLTTTVGYGYQVVTDTSLGQFLNAYHTVVANDGAITIDVEDSSGVDLSADVADGADLTGIASPEQHTTFQLKANLSRAAVEDTSPELKWWGIAYIGDTTA